VRVLFTSAGGRGHSDPLLPIARAAHAVGHAVAFCCRPPMAAIIEAAGFRAFTAGPAIAAPATIAPLQPLDTEREARVVRDGFAGRGIAHQRAAALPDVCAEWRPDVLVCDETDFGALVAAERLGLPYATVVVVAAGSFLRPDLITDPLNVLRAEHGLDPDPQLAMLSRYLTFVPGPPRFRDPAFPLAPTAHAVRPAALEAAPTDEPEPDHPGVRTVYFTLGTVFNMESGDLFDRVLAGLRELPGEVRPVETRPVEIIATVGADIDPAAFGAQPPHIRIASYIPQSSVLPRSSAVVSHGGSGTVLGALAYGVPQVLVPMGADQPFNASRCVALGIGRALDATTCTPLEVRDAVAVVLADPSYRERARGLRDESRALPGADYAVALLEQLAVDHAPIPSE
jgi:UDP:flavonoid glycosyltransferase YjiC (YdhE family)